MQTHYISFRKRPNIRLEFAIRSETRTEARLIATREMAGLHGFTFDGTN